MITVAIDTETDLIGPGNVIPKLVCASIAFRSAGNEVITRVLSSVPEDGLEQLMLELLASDETKLVFLNAGFDLAVLCRAFPSLWAPTWAKLARADLVTDIGVREKLVNLGTSGQLNVRELPDGTFQHVEYSLASLCARHLGIDISADKADDEDLWRYNYASLSGMLANEYPEDARRYAEEDARHTLGVWEAQEQVWRMANSPERGPGSMHGQYERTALQFALRLITARGMTVDPEERGRLRAWIAEELDDSKMQLLLKEGILRPGQPTRPYKNQAKRIAEMTGCTLDEAKAAIDGPWSDNDISALVAAGVKVAAGKKPSIDTKRLREFVVALVAEVNARPDVEEEGQLKVRMTEPSPSCPEGQVCTDDRMMASLEPYSPVVAEYRHRQGLQQIANKELPAMDADVVHFNFNEMVSTFRTSSYGGGKKKLYPATNGQNVNPRVRRGYVPRPGMVFCSVDYDQLELRTFAQTCYTLFGHSAMRDRINRGVDEHAYLGARLARRLSPEFAAATAEMGEDHDRRYEAFLLLKKAEDLSAREVFALYRKLAKPTGLGYPGGLGPVKFVSFAGSKTYNVHVTVDTARLFREVWFETNPEARPYFDHISRECIDPLNVGGVDEETGRPLPRYCYYSPLGLYRAGCAFTEAANGKALQSPAADGFCIAIFNSVRACFDPSLGSVLYGAHIVDEVHDELIGEWEDDARSHDRAVELAAIMVGSMSQVVTDVKISATPALMRRWDKRAEAAYDAAGRLVPWTPPAEEPKR